MFGYVIKNDKTIKRVRYVEEDHSISSVEKRRNESCESQNRLNKNTRSPIQHCPRRKNRSYRQFTLQDNKNHKSIFEENINKKGLEIIPDVSCCYGRRHLQARFQEKYLGKGSQGTALHKHGTDASSASQSFHSVAELSEATESDGANKVFDDPCQDYFKNSYCSGESVVSDFLIRRCSIISQKHGLRKTFDFDDGDRWCYEFDKRGDSDEKHHKPQHEDHLANDKETLVDVAGRESNSFDIWSASFNKWSSASDDVSESREGYNHIRGWNQWREQNVKAAFRNERESLPENILRFLNELKVFWHSNYKCQGFKGINQVNYGLKMSSEDEPTEDQKVSPRRRMTVASNQSRESKDSNKYHLKERLCDYVLNDIIGSDTVFKGPWGISPVTYLDYVASGRPLKCIEDYIQEHVMPTYANTHTEVSFTAQQTTLFREEARALIKASVNACDDDVVVFTGSGSTSAVNKLIHALKPSRPLVLVGPYEHHSNILPWTEIKGANVVRIQTTKDGLIDLDHLAWELKKGCFHKREVIGSFSAASNVTGILTDVNAVCTLLHRHKGIALFDYACAAPYVDINMNSKGRKDQDGLAYKDAVFISTHKFIGGPGTPGLLIAKKHLFRNRVPHNVGGGTVQFVRRSHVSYRIDIEDREEGGTPGIIESIRAGLVFKLKDTFTASFIMLKEEEMLRKAKLVWSSCPSLILLGNLNAARLPIFPMLYYNYETGLFLHHDFVAMVLNDVFGIQVRSGCACAGPYGMDLMGMSEEQAARFEKVTVKTGGDTEALAGFKPGFVRLNCPYFFTDETFNFVLKAVQMVATHGWKILYLYDFDPHAGKWRCKLEHRAQDKKHLDAMSFSSGQLEVKVGLGSDEKQTDAYSQVPEDAAFKNLFQGEDALTHVDTLKRAQKILTPNAEVITKYAETMKRKSDLIHNHNLRWFMLPEECVDLLSGSAVKFHPPEELPFCPGSLGVKLKMAKQTLMTHKSRRNLDIAHPVEATGSEYF